MKLAVLGAGGKTGRLVVIQAAALGNVVTAFMRHDEGQFDGMRNVNVVIGDAQIQSDINKVINGQDAVISTLGSNNLKATVIRDSTRLLVSAAKKQNVNRIIMMSSFLVSPQLKPKGLLKLMVGMMKSMLNDRNVGEVDLKKSNLEWTIVHATGLTNGSLTSDERIVRASETVGIGSKISRADVADFLIKQLTNKQTIKKSVLITTK